MNWTHLYPGFFKWVLLIGLPVVNLYHIMCGNVFLNTAATDATDLEKIGNQLLVPWQYLLVGKEATPTNDKTIPYHLTHRFDYNDQWALKTVASYVLLPNSLLLGSTVKGFSYLWQGPREHHSKISYSKECTHCFSNNALFREKGIAINEDFQSAIPIKHQGHKRRESDLQHLHDDKETLKDIVALLEAANIPHWIDCGSCLGAYRYGGAIPWDNDIDIGILAPDSDNVKRVLNGLDKEKYVVFDWSSRDRPKTYLKVYRKGSDVLVDLYHYSIDEEKQTLSYILSNENNIFMSEEWKKRELHYTKPVPFATIFPLKRGEFDGISVLVPNNVEGYLKIRYGENLDPVMIYNEKTNQYERDESHPYWKSAASGGS